MNQCQGCQSEWDFTEHSIDLADGTLKMHKVRNGYQGEVVLCTKHLHDNGKDISVPTSNTP